MHDTEDKRYWTRYGASREVALVRILRSLGIEASINPSKVEDPTAPDLIVSGELADVKCQRTPFFKAKELYGIDPQFAVTLNRKDIERYQSQFPSITIYFWVDWETLRWGPYRVKPMFGIWRATLPQIIQMLTAGIESHSYRRRITDAINARESYVLDLRQMERVYLKARRISHV